MKLSINENRKFAKKSGDLNKIHTNIIHAKKFFIRKPIVHGVNVVIRAIKKYNFLDHKFNLLEILFKDFINIDETFDFKLNKNVIYINSQFNNKVEIYRKLKKNESGVFKKEEIIRQLLFITRYIGTISPGQNSLIQKIKFTDSKIIFKKKVIKNRMVNKNVKIISFYYKNIIAEIVAIKLEPYIQKSNKSFLKKPNIIKIIKDKKIIIFGNNSDIGNFLYNSNLKKVCDINTFSSKNINNIYLLNKILRIKKPDYIFYLFSPKIIHGQNQKLLNNYLDIYLKVPKKIFEINSKYKKNFLIFYPSTFILNEEKNYQHLMSYIKSKKIAEKEFKNKKYKRIFYIKRLPQLKTRTNYSPFLGKYIGKNLNTLNQIFYDFFKR